MQSRSIRRSGQPTRAIASSNASCWHARCKCVFDIMPCCCGRCRHRPASGIFPFRDRPARGYSCRCCEARPARREDAAPTRLPPRSRWRGTRATSRRDRARRSGRRIDRRRSEAYSGNQKDGYEPGTQPTIGGTAESELSKQCLRMRRRRADCRSIRVPKQVVGRIRHAQKTSRLVTGPLRYATPGVDALNVADAVEQSIAALADDAELEPHLRPTTLSLIDDPSIFHFSNCWT